MLTVENTALVIVDVQGKLARLMHEHEALFNQLVVMTRGARELQLPILWMEQLPEKLGATIELLAKELEGIEPIRKSSFSCLGEPDCVRALKKSGCRQVLLMGIEAHICVYQTARDLLDAGYEVEVVVDAVSSRTLQNKEVALDKMAATGADLTSVEMALFELMKTAEASEFRAVSRIIK